MPGLLRALLHVPRRVLSEEVARSGHGSTLDSRGQSTRLVDLELQPVGLLTPRLPSLRQEAR